VKSLPYITCVLSALGAFTGCMAAVDDGMSSDSAGQIRIFENGREIPIASGSTKKAKLFGDKNPSDLFVVIGGVKGDPETSTFARSIVDHFATDTNESAIPQGAGVVIIEDPTDTDINNNFACKQTKISNPATDALVTFLTQRKTLIRGVVSLRSFRAADAYAGRCESVHAPSDTLAATYAGAIRGTPKAPVPGTGNLVDWLAKEGIAAVEVGAHGTAAVHAAAIRNALTITLSLHYIPQSGSAQGGVFQPYQPSVSVSLPCQITVADDEVTVRCGASSFTAPIEEDEDFGGRYAFGELRGDLIVNCQGTTAGQFASGTDTYQIKVVVDESGSPTDITLTNNSQSLCGNPATKWRFQGSL
jgi:hypothetical protein